MQNPGIADPSVPGKLDKFGLSYEEVSKINPRIIYCSVTGEFSVNCSDSRIWIHRPICLRARLRRRY